MKKTKLCPKCRSTRIGYIEHQPDLHQGSSTAFKRVVGLRPEEHDAAFGKKIEAVKVGLLEAYVCTECGYHESYVAKPSLVRWNEVAGFHWVNPGLDGDSGGPYR